MKRFLPLLVMTVLAFFPQTGFAQLTTSQVLIEAQQAYMQGDVEKAKEKFKLVLEFDPTNKTAASYLKMIIAQDNKDPHSGLLEKQLKELILPQVELRDATFNTSLDYLKQMAAKVSGGKVTASFVVQIPEEETATKKVTLSLRNVPFTEVLHYLSELTGYKFSIDAYAITVRHPSVEPAAVSTNTTTPQVPDTTVK